MKVWEKLKTESKLYYNKNKESSTGTGGGPSEIKVDPILEQVCALLGRACTGILGVQDCDFEAHDSTLPKRMCTETEIEVGEILILNNNIINDKENEDLADLDLKEIHNTQPINANISKTPLWSSRRPILSQMNERTEAVSSLCTSFTNVNKKKEDIEELKRNILQEELEFKRKLYELQLQAALTEVQIKQEILQQIKGGAAGAIHNIFGHFPKE